MICQANGEELAAAGLALGLAGFAQFRHDPVAEDAGGREEDQELVIDLDGFDRLLRERPACRALSAPGMPAGSPGMEAAGELIVLAAVTDEARVELNAFFGTDERFGLGLQSVHRSTR
ncbi:MAG: hypothetical protein B7Z37_30375 [Verrucomicrobia bacterium 12-59-8]|nr:MAG: hypothetical protein B7Z37_30375 [Verrucomicrobia bacterium 12-59-8]